MRALLVVCLTCLTVASVEARVVRLVIDRREPVLDGRAFGLAGPYEKLVGRAEFALDPDEPRNQRIVDLSLGPKNAEGDVEFSADIYILKPLDPSRGNGRVFYEVGNRGGKRILSVFQNGTRSADPTDADDFGTGDLMRQGFTLVWMGWQWDVPEGRMRMEIPIAAIDDAPLTGLVRGNFILDGRADTASVADRGHRAYPVVDPDSDDHVMTVRNRRLDPPTVVERSRWRFVGPGLVALDGGFDPGRIYDVVYTARDPRIVGCGLAGTRDLISFLKDGIGADHPTPGIEHAIAWGNSQSGRFLRHFLYQGFNEDELGRRVFDGVIDQAGGAGRGSFNHRFGQASRDALHHYNILFPVDMFPFTDGLETDPETGVTDGVLAQAERTGTVPKLFHLLTSSEYYNRSGSLVHTDPTGTRDVELPETTRIYLMSSVPHVVGRFPPVDGPGLLLGQAPRNPLVRAPLIRALFRSMDAWVADDVEPPASQYPRLSDATLVAPGDAGWPTIPNMPLPHDPLAAYRLDFGPRWSEGIVDREPPGIGKPFVVRVPAVDATGNDRAGIRLPEIEVPLATHTGWNYRHSSIGAPDHLAGEIGSYLALPLTETERADTGDSRAAVESRYRDRDDYRGKISAAALLLIEQRLLLPEDLPGVLERAVAHYDWVTRSDR